jgi:hypothetical protein
MNFLVLLSLVTFAAASPLCTSSLPVATPSTSSAPKICTRICGDESIVCGAEWVSILRRGGESLLMEVACGAVGGEYAYVRGGG